MRYRKLQQLLDEIQASSSALPSVEGDFPLNVAVLKALPGGSRAIRADHHGVSNIWYCTGAIQALSSDGRPIKYFVKYGVGDLGRKLIVSEHHAMATIYTFTPHIVPTPIANGKLDLLAASEGYFFLSSFIDFERSGLPGLAATAKVVAQLHTSSLGKSQMFGSPIPMYDGLFPHVNGWNSNWTTMFSKMLWQAYSCDRLLNDPCELLDAAIAPTMTYVIPRLLDDLDKSRGGIKPCFVHGDLWEGNVGREMLTGKHFIFDSNGYYGHNEMELAYWRTEHHKMNELDYCAEYSRHMPPSEPVLEQEDRLKLYGLKACLMYAATERDGQTRLKYIFTPSSLFPRMTSLRRALSDMNYLLRKYAPKHFPDTAHTPALPVSPSGFVFEANGDEGEISVILEDMAICGANEGGRDHPDVVNPGQ